MPLTFNVSHISPIPMSEKEAADFPGYAASVRIHTSLSVGRLLLHIFRHTKFPPVFLPWGWLFFFLFVTILSEDNRKGRKYICVWKKYKLF